MRLDVAVVGAGFAGMGAALFLARAGHHVTIFERAATPGPVGAAIVLQPSGLAVLRALGLDAAVERRAARIDRLHVTTPRGKTIVDLRYATLDPRWYGIGLGRGVLFDALWSALAPAGVAVVTGAEVHGLERVGRRHALALADGQRTRPFDLVVAADGARSRAADHLPGRVADPYPWGALFFVGAAPDSVELRQVGDGARRFMGVLPMGAGRASLFWSLRADRLDAWRRGFTAWRDEARRMDAHAVPLVDAIRAPDEVLFAPYFDVRMRSCTAPGLVAIGDAAHATSPQLGQGSNLALWDALTLGASLAAGDLVGGLAAYERARRRHLAYYQLATRWLTPLFQSDSRLLGWARDLGFPLAQRLPLVRRFVTPLMTRSMAGIATGFFGSASPLPAPWP